MEEGVSSGQSAMCTKFCCYNTTEGILVQNPYMEVKKGGSIKGRGRQNPFLKPSNQTEDVWMASTDSEGADHRAAFHGFLRLNGSPNTAVPWRGAATPRLADRLLTLASLAHLTWPCAIYQPANSSRTQYRQLTPKLATNSPTTRKRHASLT